jgi:hypothetical protein
VPQPPGQVSLHLNVLTYMWDRKILQTTYQ